VLNVSKRMEGLLMTTAADYYSVLSIKVSS